MLIVRVLFTSKGIILMCGFDFILIHIFVLENRFYDIFCTIHVGKAVLNEKNSNLLKFAAGVFFVTLMATTATVDAQQARYKMTTDIPASITTPDSVQTSLGTLRFFAGFHNTATVMKVYDNLDFQRGVQTFLTALPAASTYAMCNELRSFIPGRKIMF